MLDYDTPLPLFTSEEEVALGILPRDTLVRQPADTGVDIMLLGHAHAPASPTTELDVRMSVGGHHWALRVTGDRLVHEHNGELVLAPPLPFTTIPLTWERTFGGAGDVWFDPTTVLPVSAPVNRRGRGYDVAGAARRLAESIGAPEGFPRSEETVRWAPNVENPFQLMSPACPEPTPYCWAPMPPDLELRGADPNMHDVTHPFSYAHPQLRRLRLSGQEAVQLDGVQGGSWAFRLPAMTLRMDYEIATRSGSLPLNPTQILLFPDERSISISYQRSFKFRLDREDIARSVCLRME